ncbi:alpha-amylase family glycosyl hydrolase [uncultured Bacteroides sp.]|uniref:alpha-amylase family glycosyl hydrolase n=1 Tax=uncultured Bacteroides sp. TaxID=162156 RepID=UPI002AA7FD78|nr:alpha-amylase family glycosyl hydrolase [uncultured Bacteroides sp.]
MKKISFYLFSLITIVLFTNCSGDNPIDTPVTPPVVLKDGLNYSLETPDADKELTITFKATGSSALYNYTGDVYIHAGVIVDGNWMYVPAEWSENLPKCKMTKGDSNVWSITLSPSIRSWFGSGETSIQKLGIVIRSSDGTLKGLTDDSFVTVTDSKYAAFVPAAIKNATLPSGVEEGINVVNSSTVTLVLYDKDKSGNHKDYAYVVGDFNDWTLTNDEKSQMYRDDAAGCWWITISGLTATKEYAFQYYVGTAADGAMRLADAYSRKVLDPDNDSSIASSTYPDNKTYPTGKAVGIASVFQIQPDAYSWQHTNFKIQDKTNLVIYEMLLRDFTSSGDINGAMAKLNYIKSMGVNAIELMPVQEFDGNDSWGYNPCFYFALDKAYGTDTMYKEFIDKCHELGLAVIFDVVYNQASGNQPFAKLYWNSATGKPAANNPWFNVDAPHPYSVFNDFNHESPLVRAFVKRNLKFLLTEYKIDGFRFDLTKGFTQKASTEGTASNYDATRIAILKDYNSVVKETNPDAMVILEHFCATSEEAELATDGMFLWRNMNNAYCQSAMGWVDSSDFSGLYYGTSMPAGSLVGYMESHDEERMSYKQVAYGNYTFKTNLADRMKQLEVNTAFFLTVPGPKMIWQFGELGYDHSIDENGRTGKKPIEWGYYDDTNRKALYDTYAKLMALRDAYPELFDTSATFSWQVQGDTNWLNGRFITLQIIGKDAVVAGNFTDTSGNYTVTFPHTGTWYNYVSGGTLEVTSTTQPVTVPAHEFRMYLDFQTAN